MSTLNTAVRLAAYGAAVLLLGVGAFATGNAVGAPADRLPPATPEQTTDHRAPSGHGDPRAATSDEAHALPAGLASAAGGYALVPTRTTLPSRTATELAFRITGPDGATVTDFDVAHEKQLHLILVRSDTADFQHLHPTMSADGTWRAPVTLAGAGTYRAFADFAPTGGAATTLGVDLFAPGEFTPRTLPESRTATVAGGYEVTVEGALTPGRSSDLALTVTRGGRPVSDLQPYLGAYGHLVALRTGDLGYLHVHPDGAPGDGTTTPGPRIAFHAEVPTAGTYRLFLDFQHDGAVHTAEFTVPTGGR